MALALPEETQTIPHAETKNYPITHFSEGGSNFTGQQPHKGQKLRSSSLLSTSQFCSSVSDQTAKMFKFIQNFKPLLRFKTLSQKSADQEQKAAPEMVYGQEWEKKHTLLGLSFLQFFTQEQGLISIYFKSLFHLSV